MNHLTLPSRPLVLRPVSRALRVSHFSWLALGFVKQEEAVSARRGRSAQLGIRLTEHTPHAHEKSTAHQCRNQTCLIYIRTMGTWLSEHTWWLHWLGKLSKNQLTSTSKRRAEEDSRIACHVCLSSKKIKCPDLCGTDVLRSEKGWFGEFTAIMHNIRLFPFIIV